MHVLNIVLHITLNYKSYMIVIQSYFVSFLLYIFTIFYFDLWFDVEFSSICVIGCKYGNIYTIVSTV